MPIIKHINCRFCQGRLKKVINLGLIPPVNFFPDRKQKINKYPLELAVCTRCELLQLDTLVSPRELFKNYHYLTGASAPLVNKLRLLAKQSIAEFQLNSRSKVLDIGSNDGTFLANFIRKNIFALGVKPARQGAEIAQKKVSGH